MDALIARNRQFLTDLFSGPFRGHGIIMDPMPPEGGFRGDLTLTERPLTDWLDYWLRDYETQVAKLQALEDDSVPHVRIGTGTQIFAAAFGSPVHVYDDSPACALPRVRTAREADKLATPAVDAPPLDRVWEFARIVRDRLGPAVPLRVPDIQSPFDIAALVWRKEDLYLALMDDPAAVMRLVEKCHDLLSGFLKAFCAEFGEVNLSHCPHAWAPPELGCWLSEDEAGAMSTAMFEEFCLPVLTRMSQDFGGMFIHCCATADHQYGVFKKIPNLRGMNRVFQAPGPGPAVEAFSGQAVLMLAWMGEQDAARLLELARPDTRYLFNMPAQPLEEAKRTHERLREMCPRG